VRAPKLDGIYGKPVAVQIPPSGLTGSALFAALPKIQATTLVADERYIHDSIVLPDKEVAGGYLPIMPSFKNQLTEEEIFRITAYIRSLAQPETGTVRTPEMPPTRTLSQEEYKARTGFVPANMKNLTSGTSAPGPPGSSGRLPNTGNLTLGNASSNQGRTPR